MIKSYRDITNLKEVYFMKTIVIILASLIAAGAIGMLVFGSNNPEKTTESTSEVVNSTSDQNVDPSNPSQNPSESIFILLDIQKHNDQSSCWTIVNDLVYDITRYIPSHPGGQEILRACGADGTTLFNTRTTESGEKIGSGTAHSSTANGILAPFKIGVFSN